MKTKHHHIILSAPEIQSGDQTLNNSIRRKWFALALGGFLFTSIFALSASLVEAGCQQYDVSGQWTIEQGSFVIPVALTQNGKTVSGTAFHVSHNKSEESHVDTNDNYVHGQVTGTVEGESFNVQINWSGGGAGVYRGTINQGVLAGTTYDKNNPASTASWHTAHYFNCAAAPAAPAAPAPPAPPKLHKAKPATSTQLPVYGPTPVSGSGTKGGFIQMYGTTPTPTPSAEAAESASAEGDESSSNDTEDQHGKHKKNKKKHHHHHDDDQNQGND
jgi:hypothetical protein